MVELVDRDPQLPLPHVQQEEPAELVVLEEVTELQEARDSIHSGLEVQVRCHLDREGRVR